MRTVIQRVSEATVRVDGQIVGEIGTGLLVLLGIGTDDTTVDADWLAGKISRLRIFPDEGGKMNRSINDIDGNTLIISQFTLMASYKKGNRPSYIRAARPEVAIPLYEHFLQIVEVETGRRPERGIFGADMQVELLNDGPVTIIMDSKKPE